MRRAWDVRERRATESEPEEDNGGEAVAPYGGTSDSGYAGDASCVARAGAASDRGGEEGDVGEAAGLSAMLPMVVG